MQTYTFGKWGLGAELGPCTGMFFLTGDSKQKINDGWCYANVGLIMSYNKFHYMLQIGGISATLNDSIPFGDLWKKDNHIGSVHLQLSVGYELVNTKLVNVIPFASGGSKSFSTDEGSGNDYSRTKMKPSYSLGFALDFKINSPVKEKNKFPGSEYVVQYFYVRILSGIYPNYLDNSLNVNGSMYFVNLSTGGYFKPRRKV
ncbi:MAG: hypothetical protein IPQ05_00130 [Leptospiraceae bacterium]|nr:hypothetical protein [Leptospiraceae bacterium]